MTDASHNGACAHGGSERQANGFMLPDTLDPNREMKFDRLGTSVTGPISCNFDKTMTSPICRMKTPGHTLALTATYDRQTTKCHYNANTMDAVANSNN